jgi:hypothetical protein
MIEKVIGSVGSVFEKLRRRGRDAIIVSSSVNDEPNTNGAQVLDRPTVQKADRRPHRGTDICAAPSAKGRFVAAVQLSLSCAERRESNSNDGMTISVAADSCCCLATFTGQSVSSLVVFIPGLDLLVLIF